MLSFLLLFCVTVVLVIIWNSVIFVFLQLRVLSEYAFRTDVSVFTASCLIVSFGSLRISLHKTL